MKRTSRNRKRKGTNSMSKGRDSTFIQGARRVETIARELSALKRLVNVEEKNIDTSVTVAPIVGTPYIAPINLVGQGDTAQDRNGNSIKVLRTKMQIFATAAVGSAPAFVRIILVRDKQTNGALPVITDILSSNLLQSFRSVNTEERFVWIYDETHAVDIISDAQIFDRIVRPTMFHQEFKGTTGLIGDISTNSLILVIMTNAGANTPVVTVSTRVRYVDN